VPNESLAERLNGKLYRLALALMVAYVVVISFGPVMDNVDLGWQVAQGQWMVQHAAPYSHDVLNYPNLDRPVINEYPLFEVVLYLAWCLGWWGPCLLTALVYVVLVGALIRMGWRSDRFTASCLVIAMGLMLFFLQVGALLRPHIVTYLAIILLGTFPLRHRDATSWAAFWPVALLQVVWTNCHSGFVIGPAMVGLFGTEMTVRHALRDRAMPWPTLKTWLGAFLLILLACLVNPYGWERFYPAIFQDRLESIRAYVGEMEPLGGGAGPIYNRFAVFALAVGLLVGIRRRGALCGAFLFLALLFFWEAESAKKAWPVFGLFLPLLVLGGNAFAPAPPVPGKDLNWIAATLVNFIAGSLLALLILAKLDGLPPLSLKTQWRELDHGRSELSLEATAWMKAHAIEGRLFHRCEDGGWLQMSGYDHGETFSDTGFGKYNEAFIHEVGLVNERPALVTRFLAAYQPSYVVCNNFCFQWPCYLKRIGWRLIFYSPNSSVWTRPELGLDLPTVRDEEIKASFDRDLAANGLPADVALLGRNLLALNSLGLEDFAFARLTGLPREFHSAPWYWEAARFDCFAEPAFSPAHRDALMREAESLRNDPLTAEFRAYYFNFEKLDVDGAFHILQSIPPRQLGNYAAELLLKIELDRKQPEALALARRTDCFDLRNGRHWQYLAQAEERAGNLEAAGRAWRKAVFYYPDDAALMTAATVYAAKHGDATLANDIAASKKIYGKP
jgi:hypothetical protein